MTQVALMTAVLCVVSPWVIVLPFSPVPLSFSLFAVLLTAYLLGARAGVICCGLYLLLGGVGLPVFSGGVGGPGKLLGPTGGYLIGYLVAAGVTGYAADRWRKCRVMHLAGMIFGVCSCYAAGTFWLCLSMKVSVAEGLWMGVIPYFPADGIKVVAAFLLGYHLRKRMKKGM